MTIIANFSKAYEAWYKPVRHSAVKLLCKHAQRILRFPDHCGRSTHLSRNIDHIAFTIPYQEDRIANGTAVSKNKHGIALVGRLLNILVHPKSVRIIFKTINNGLQPRQVLGGIHNTAIQSRLGFVFVAVTRSGNDEQEQG